MRKLPDLSERPFPAFRKEVRSLRGRGRSMKEHMKESPVVIGQENEGI
jgi:hypothetical protein